MCDCSSTSSRSTSGYGVGGTYRGYQREPSRRSGVAVVVRVVGVQERAARGTVAQTQGHEDAARDDWRAYDAAKPEQYPEPDTKDTASNRTTARDRTKAAKPTPSRSVALRRNGSRGRRRRQHASTRRDTEHTQHAAPIYSLGISTLGLAVS